MRRFLEKGKDREVNGRYCGRQTSCEVDWWVDCKNPRKAIAGQDQDVDEVCYRRGILL